METFELLPGVRLRCFRDDRFKHGCLSIQFLRRMTAEETPYNALLPAVLLRGTARHPDLLAIHRTLENLYGAEVRPLVRRIGDLQATGLYCSLLDDRFALPGEQVLEPVLEFLGELLLQPRICGDGFDAQYVEGEKQNLIAAIDAELNDKQAWAARGLLKQMCRGDSFGLPLWGEREDVGGVTAEGLYRHYREVLRTSPVEVFYVGSAQPERLRTLLLPIFAGMERVPESLPAQTDLVTGTPEDRVEYMEVTQGQLCLGCTTPITNRSPEFAAMQVLNTVLGGGMYSKLFRTVREEQSLCYSVHSSYYGIKGIVLISVGIDFRMEREARWGILAQLTACQNGEITEQELSAAKKALISSLRATHDSPGAVEGYYTTALLGGLGMTPEDYIRAVEAVTVADAVAAAKTVELHSSYFVRGKEYTLECLK